MLLHETIFKETNSLSKNKMEFLEDYHIQFRPVEIQSLNMNYVFLLINYYSHRYQSLKFLKSCRNKFGVINLMLKVLAILFITILINELISKTCHFCFFETFDTKGRIRLIEYYLKERACWKYKKKNYLFRQRFCVIITQKKSENKS